MSWHGVEVKPGPYVRLRVQDTGQGMDESVRQRVFEPFYHDQAAGEGDGAGIVVGFWDCEAERRVCFGVERTGAGDGV